MKYITILLAVFALSFTACSTLETPDARVTVSEPYVATETGLVAASSLAPGSYAVNQVIEPGTYTRADLQKFAPGPLPQSVAIEPGNSLSMLEVILASLGGVANSVPGGQPVGVALLGLAGIAQIWRDKQTIKLQDREIDDAYSQAQTLHNIAKTLGATLDTSLDVVATLPDREQAAKIEAQINGARDHFAKSYEAARDILDKILQETATPTKAPINADS